MAEHQDEGNPQKLGPVLERREHGRRQHIACDPSHEEIPLPLIEDQLRGHSGIRAAEDRSHGGLGLAPTAATRGPITLNGTLSGLGRSLDQSLRRDSSAPTVAVTDREVITLRRRAKQHQPVEAASKYPRP